MTLVKYLHSRDPDVIQNAELKVPDYSEMNDLQVLFGPSPCADKHMQRGSE
jgi:hypothetical protein